MKHFTKLLLAMAVTMGLATGVAANSAPKATHNVTILTADNSDGKITKSELEEARTKRMKQRAAEGKMLKNAGEGHSFSTIDTNKDGSISEKEFMLHKTIHHPQACITFG